MKLRFPQKWYFYLKYCVTWPWEEDSTFINTRACIVTSSFRMFLRFKKHSFLRYFNFNTTCSLSHNLTIVGKTTFEACSFKKSQKMHISKLLYNSSSNKRIIYCTILFIDQKICGYCWYESNWSRGKLHLGHTAYVKNMFGHRTTADVSVVAMYLWKRPKLIRVLLSS